MVSSMADKPSGENRRPQGSRGTSRNSAKAGEAMTAIRLWTKAFHPTSSTREGRREAHAENHLRGSFTMVIKPASNQILSRSCAFLSLSRRSAAGIALLVGVAGCAQDQTVKTVPDQWHDNLRALGLTSVYPPSEDIKIGDLYVLGGGQARHLDYLPDAIQQLKTYYSARMVLPATNCAQPEMTAQASAGGAAAGPSASGSSLRPVAAVSPKSVAPTSAGHGTKQRTTPQASAADAPALAHGGTGPCTSSGAQPASSASAIWTQPVDEQGIFRDPPTIDRPALVVFPGVTLASGQAIKFSASAPLRFFNLLFGITDQDTTTVTLSIAQAETLSLPDRRAMQMLDTYCCPGGGAVNPICGIDALQSEVDELPVPDQANSSVLLALVNQVYYTRSITYQFQASSSAGAEFSFYDRLASALRDQKSLVDLLTQQAHASNPSGGATAANSAGGSGSGAAATKAAASSATGSGPGAAGASSDQVLAGMANIQNQLQQMLDQLSSSSVPGASFSLTSFSARSITLTQVFSRPVAVGYRSFRTRAYVAAGGAVVGEHYRSCPAPRRI
jgi:hypothetical protein